MLVRRLLIVAFFPLALLGCGLDLSGDGYVGGGAADAAPSGAATSVTPASGPLDASGIVETGDAGASAPIDAGASTSVPPVGAGDAGSVTPDAGSPPAPPDAATPPGDPGDQGGDGGKGDKPGPKGP
jgi:hypothetical protein